MTREALLSRLEGVRPEGAGHMALCPAHDDHSPSLSITMEGERILLHCFAGCETEDIVRKLGIGMSDLFVKNDKPANGAPKHDGPPPWEKPIVKIFDYTDERGKLVYQVVRHPDKPDGKKDFSQRRLDGGKWVWNLNGVEPVLYRLPEVVKAVEAGVPIFVVEGEKDVHTLESLGLVATTNSGGAGNWTDSEPEHLRGAQVRVLGDNDKAGREHVAKVCRSLDGIAGSLKVVELPGVAEKEDVTDWLEAGHTREELLAQCEAAPEWEPGEEQADESAQVRLSLPDALTHAELVRGELPAVEWIVDGIFPAGGISMIGGDSGVGKSWLTLHLAQAVAAGLSFVGKFGVRQSSVLVFDAESGPHLLERRVKKLFAGLRLEHPDVPEDLPLTIVPSALKIKGDTVSTVAEYLTERNIGLVLADPLIHFAGVEENSAEGMAGFFEAVREIANLSGCTFLFTHHSRKESRMASNAAGQMLRGSSAIRAILDSHVFVRKLKGGSLLCEHDKSRHAETVDNFLVEIADAGDAATTVHFIGLAEKCLEKIELAEDCALRTLTAAGGVAARQDIVAQARAEQIAERTMNDALRRLEASGQITREKRGKQSICKLCALHDTLFKEEE